MLQEESSHYALFMNSPDPKITKEEFKVFIAILILSGYNSLPSERLYWDSEYDVNNALVTNAMRRDRFIQIKRCLHFVDNKHVHKTDKMWKLRPLMDILRSKFIEHFQPEQDLSYDESMIAYYGKHGCKQFIRGKPIRFGFKMWCLNTSTGYLINFDVYQGKNPKANTHYEEALGKCAAPLASMIEELPRSKRNLAYNIYFDNLFTSSMLLLHLKEINYRGTGTIRVNRMDKKCPLSNLEIFKKKDRGAMEFAKDVINDIIIVRWLDNNVVTVASSAHGIYPFSKVRRYSQKEKRIISVPQPHAISQYNKFMGGTDLMDEKINAYRIHIRGKKWWWPIFTWLVDATVQNAWILDRKTNKSRHQLDFRRSIVLTYLQRFANSPKGAGRNKLAKDSSIGIKVPDEIRLDHRDHLVRFIPSDKRWRCAGINCSSITRTMCVKCSIGLRINCFVQLHSDT